MGYVTCVLTSLKMKCCPGDLYILKSYVWICKGFNDVFSNISSSTCIIMRDIFLQPVYICRRTNLILRDIFKIVILFNFIIYMTMASMLLAKKLLCIIMWPCRSYKKFDLVGRLDPNKIQMQRTKQEIVFAASSTFLLWFENNPLN